jgi:hypothetical protein
LQALKLAAIPALNPVGPTVLALGLSPNTGHWYVLSPRNHSTVKVIQHQDQNKFHENSRSTIRHSRGILQARVCTILANAANSRTVQAVPFL